MGVGMPCRKEYFLAMTNPKNLLIATLTGLLVLSLFTLPAQSAPKTYDAVKLVQYEACLRLSQSGKFPAYDAFIDIAKYSMPELLRDCLPYKP